MTPTELRALADRCEAGAGADRKLDADIAVATKAVPYDMEPAFGDGCWRGIYDSRYWDAPDYTGSIDAAMTLVGDAAWRVEDHPLIGPCAIVGEQEGYARAPALALAAASLRAKASLLEDGGRG